MSERPLLSPRLKDLPIEQGDTFLGGGAEDGISSKYRKELSQVHSAKGLRAFVLRWRVLWVLDRVHLSREYLSEVGSLLWTGRFNTKKVWRTFRKMTPSYQPPVRRKSHHWQIAASIKVPPPFIRGLIAGEHFGVPEDLALVQLYQGVEFF